MGSECSGVVTAHNLFRKRKYQFVHRIWIAWSQSTYNFSRHDGFLATQGGTLRSEALIQNRRGWPPCPSTMSASAPCSCNGRRSLVLSSGSVYQWGKLEIERSVTAFPLDVIVRQHPKQCSSCYLTTAVFSIINCVWIAKKAVLIKCKYICNKQLSTSIRFVPLYRS